MEREMLRDFPFPKDVPIDWSCRSWRYLMARFFGERFESFEGPWHSVAYYWRGVLYWKTMESCKPTPLPE